MGLCKTACNRIMKLLSIALIFFFFCLFLSIFYSYTYDICQIYYISNERNLLLGVSMLLIGYYLAFTILFNYVMAVFVHPGQAPRSARILPSVIEQLDPSFYANNSEGSDDDDDEVIRQNINKQQHQQHNRRGRHSTDLENQNHFNRQSQQEGPKICRKCTTFKPNRAHHCSICDVCVYKMDHHCPWIDGCVGHDNHRYFLSFILYLFIATTYISILFLNITYNHGKYTDALYLRSTLYPIIKPLSMIISIILFFFNAWNWYLAARGLTAIEFWGKPSLVKPDTYDSDLDYTYPTVRENLAAIFGTNSYFLMILPSIRPLEHDGKLIALGSCCVSGQTYLNMLINGGFFMLFCVNFDVGSQYQKRDQVQQGKGSSGNNNKSNASKRQLKYHPEESIGLRSNSARELEEGNL